MNKIISFVVFVFAAYYSYAEAPSKLELQSRFSALASRQQWTRLRDETSNILNDYITLNWYNLAQAYLGKQTEQLFDVNQHGPMGLIFISRDVVKNDCLAHVMFACGNYAAAQNLAFNGLFTDEGIDYSMLKMLCCIEYIRGNDIVAEKYRKLLLSSRSYKQWAKNANTDPQITRGRKEISLPIDRFIFQDSPIEDLLDILSVYPSDSLVMQYVLSFYLLSKDMKSLASVIDRYYGTAALKSLPTPVQEALLFYSEMSRNLGTGDEPVSLEYCRNHGVTAEVERRFAAFQNASLRSNGKAPSGYDKTFWYYLLYT